MKTARTDEPLVTIQCATYNHANFIRDCLDGFVSQKTDFKFQILIHDDASTDGTADIIREYVERYPDLFVPIFQKENRYRRGLRLKDILLPLYKGRYVAICEGDDYWTDPLKLQKQVDFLEAHPDYTMVCNRTEMLSVRRGRFIGEVRSYDHSCPMPLEDIVRNGGGFVATCSILHRREVTDHLLDYHSGCAVGDWPLQIRCGLLGKVYYMDDKMTVYRTENSRSMVGQWQADTIYSPQRLKGLKTEVAMLEGYARDFPEHAQLLRDHQGYFINVLFNLDRRNRKVLRQCFRDDMRRLGIGWRIDWWLRIRNWNKYVRKYVARYYPSRGYTRDTAEWWIIYPDAAGDD